MKRIQTDVVVIGGGIVGTWLAKELVKHNIRVVVVERGAAAKGVKLKEPEELNCNARENFGSRVARNHVLGGNGAYWGGGLIRQDCDNAIWGRKSINLDKSYEQVERALRFPHSPSRNDLQDSDGLWTEAEIFVLPGRARNISALALAELHSSAIAQIITNSEITGIRLRTGEPKAIASLYCTSQDCDIEIEAGSFVISSGVVDSNLIILKLREELGVGDDLPIGLGLHDHFSVPLFRLENTKGTNFLHLITPRFKSKFVVGRRYETRLNDQDNTGGLLHFQYMFDEISPYKELKALSALLQRRADKIQIVKKTTSLLPHLGALIRIGITWMFKKKLHISANVPIVATLDFESCGSLKNRIFYSRDENATLTWNVQDEDEKVFTHLVEDVKNLLETYETRYGVKFAPLFDVNDDHDTISHLRKRAVDAYHLGGGLAVGKILDEDMKFRGIKNLFVISTAAFSRPGLVNPVLTLLALASRFAATFNKTADK